MTAYTDFHYSPTGSGVISGAQVLEQTEQGINGLGQYVQDNVSGAIDTANQALTVAQTANSNATLALNTANSFAAQIAAANNTAGNALTTAQSAQNTANSASSLATTANNNANTALNTANSASAGVTTLTGTVNSLGNRMTAAENAINANAGNITNLQNALNTTNGNVTAAQNAANAAQATATSAQSTATLARNQAYVLRYTGTTITGGGTIAYADIDNTDNIKAGDKIIDVTGNIYRIASVDLVNETVTVDASDIIHLATDSDVVHKTGNETIGGAKYWTYASRYLKPSDHVQATAFNVRTDPSEKTGGDVFRVWDGTNDNLSDYLGGASFYQNTDGSTQLQFNCFGYPASGNAKQNRITFRAYRDGTTEFYPEINGNISFGKSDKRWKSVYADSYYYGTTAWGLDKANTWSANNQFAKINTIETNTVEWHNSHYRGINLISDGHFADMAALLTAIRAQDWSDIYIGDYVELTFTYEGASRTVKFYVGEIDKFYKVGNTSLETHHLVMVTGDLGINQVMNDSNTTAGGYVGSKAHTVTLPALYAILNPLFNNAILTHREHLSNTVLSAQTVSLSLDDGNGAVTYSCNNFPVYSSGDPNTPGCVTAGNWYDCNLVLMSEIEMFGSNRFASSGIDDIMCPEGQIAAFKYNRNLQTLNRTINTWLRNVNSASRFCDCISFGVSNRSGATNTFLRLRPRFLIG